MFAFDRNNLKIWIKNIELYVTVIDTEMFPKGNLVIEWYNASFSTLEFSMNAIKYEQNFSFGL